MQAANFRATGASGWDTNAHTRIRAATAGLVVAESLEELAAVSEVLFVAVPMPDIGGVFAGISGLVEPSSIVTDVTSVKQPVRDLAATHEFTFVGGHPMAGTEASGFAASDAELLAEAAWVLTIDEGTDLTAWLTLAGLITSLGCRVIPCTSLEHDRAVARVSHLPHILAAALSIAAADDPLGMTLAAGSFRDATRVATTRPELIAAMCGGNSDALGPELSDFVARLQDALFKLDQPDALASWFAAAGAVRANWPPVVTHRTDLPIDDKLAEQLLAAGRAGGQVTAVTTEHVVLRGPSA